MRVRTWAVLGLFALLAVVPMARPQGEQPPSYVLSLAERVAKLEAQSDSKAEAIHVALEAQDKRLNSMNEFRQSLTDLSAKFVTRSEFMWAFGTLATVLVGLAGIVFRSGIASPGGKK